MAYQLICFDMDGTLLASDKRVLQSSLDAIAEAQAAGKFVAIATGRAPRMVEMNTDELSMIRYVVCSSGAQLMDLTTGEVTTVGGIDPAVLERIFELVDGLDVGCEAFIGHDFYTPEFYINNTDHYDLGIYASMYKALAVPCNDLRSACLAPDAQVTKFLMHFVSEEDKEKVNAGLIGMPCVLADSEAISIEVSPAGIDKGTGVVALAAKLGVDISEVITVGDQANDIPMLRVAGLGVAMGNAIPETVEAADVQVADNNNGGCAQAIREYLLA